jgi:hypothetical protein
MRVWIVYFKNVEEEERSIEFFSLRELLEFVENLETNNLSLVRIVPISVGINFYRVQKAYDLVGY